MMSYSFMGEELWYPRSYKQKLYRRFTLVTRALCNAVSEQLLLFGSQESQEIAFVQKCPECVKLTPNPKEPLHPWERVAADLFQLNGSTYLLVVHYFSRYPEVIKLNTTTSKTVISSLKLIFSRQGIPSILMSDNGPQFDSSEM